MNYEEFLRDDPSETTEKDDSQTEAIVDAGAEVEEALPEAEELDVQKAVVESLAADKAEQEEALRKLRSEVAIKDGQIKAQTAMMASLHNEITTLKANVAALERQLSAEQSKELDQQERNPNALALLDRDIELPDRFPGESRDHVLEALKEARQKAEEEGRVRHAQVLESVLVANEPNGTLAKRRAALESVFAENGNIINGPVLAELERLGIAHKNGENYLLPCEILKRAF